MIRKLVLLLFLAMYSAGFAQRDSTATSLQEVVINAIQVSDSLLRAPASVAILSEADLQRNNLSDIAPILNSVAGVFMQSGSLNTNRISIRGIGARTPYGTNKIRAFYGNIPLTSGDSETTIEDIDLESLSQIEIIKGPLSSVYGGGLAGAILLSPKIVNYKSQDAKISTTYGSFGLAKTTIGYSLASEKNSFNISYNNLQLDGWRQNSNYDRESVTLSGTLFQTPKSKLTYLGNYTFLKAFIASSVDRETHLNTPRKAAFTWNASKGYEQYDSYLGGLSYEFELSNAIRNATSIFINSKISDEARPFDILRQNTTGYGARTQFTAKLSTTRILFGAEYFRDNFDSQTLENLYEDNNGNGSLAGNKLTSNSQERSFINLFAQFKMPIFKKLALQGGLNLNKTNFVLNTTFPDAIEKQDYSYDAIWSPQLSLIYNIGKFQTLYSSVSRGFSLPSITETLGADGTINTNIKPETGLNYELGTKMYFFNRSLYAEASLFTMKVQDLLVARRVGDDQYIGVNAGETLHRGLEMSLNYRKEFGKIQVNPFLALSASEYKFEKFVDDGNDFSGNNLTGFPDRKLNVGIVVSVNNLYFSSDYQYVGGFPINDANSVYTSAYQIWNLKSGVRLKILKNLSSHISAGVNNVGNEKYASQVLVNATSFGNSQPRYYYPGLPVNYFGNFTFNYNF